MKLSEIDRPIVIAILIIAIGLLIYFLVVPEYYRFLDTQEKLGIVKGEYEGKFAYYSEVERIFAELEDRRESLEKVENAITSEPQLADLMYFFNQKSIESGLIMKSIALSKVAPVAAESNIKEIAFSLDTLGNYQGLKNFLSLMEGSSRLIQVGNLSFGSQAQSQSTAQGQGQIVLPGIEELYNFSFEVKAHSY